MVGTLSYAEHLDKQLRFLETSCREYDAGNFDEAIRIATALRVMFHNTDRSTSLLVYLGATSINMLSTAGRRKSNPNSNGYWPALVHIDIDMARKTVTARPTFNDRLAAHRVLPFSAWWDSDVIFAAAHRKIKRNRLVVDAANKDGGAHVDNKAALDYRFFQNGAGFSFSVERASGERVESHLVNAHQACLRQLAHEVFNSPELLKLAGRVS